MPRTRIQIIPHLDYAELTERYRRCQDVKEQRRWLVICLLSQPDHPRKVEQVAEITGVSTDWVRKIARRYNTLGPEAIIDGHSKSPGGKKPALTPEQQKQLLERLQSPPEDGGLWSGPLVVELIKQYFGIRVHRATAWEYLKRLGFTFQVSRPLHTLCVSKEQRAIFKPQLAYDCRSGTSTDTFTLNSKKTHTVPVLRRHVMFLLFPPKAALSVLG